MDDMMLIVDDVEMNREILKVLFHDKFDFIEADTGEEAMAILEGCQNSIDIVLLDLVMPGMSGFEVLKRRAESEALKSIPVVVITSSGQMDDQIRAFDLGANDFISKPFMPEIVLSRVNNVMASNRRMLSIEMEAQRLKIQSQLDEMTGLLNKVTCEMTMDSSLKCSDRRLEAMLVIDIDNFKTVNDTSGHQSGDHVIKIIANLISSLFRKTDIVGRIGGDEFCVMMVDVPDMDIVRSKANELIQIMRYKPNLTIPEYVTLSIGVASNNKKNTSYIDLFQKADHALYEAKQSGRAQYREYGVEPVRLENDERPVALLLSNNRSVCSVVHAMIPACLRMVEALKLADLDTISEENRQKISIVYVDVSDCEAPDQVWSTLQSLPWLNMDRVFAICQEGNVPQYMSALKNGVADMFTAPVDSETFKRRTIRKLEELGIVEKQGM